MPNFLDFSLNVGNFTKAQQLTQNEVFAFAIRNILLSRPGNYPSQPGLGMNVQKYNLSLANQQTLDAVREDLTEQILRYLPTLENVSVTTGFQNADDENDKTNYLTIAVSALNVDTYIGSNFIVFKDSMNETIVLNENY